MVERSNDVIIIRITIIPILYVCQGIAVNEIRAGNLSANFTTVKKTSLVLDYKRKHARNSIHYFGPEKSEIVFTIIIIRLKKKYDSE
jgi:hypothetical protein